jgi:hypothetical protein
LAAPVRAFAAPQNVTPAIAPEAGRILSAMGEYLKAAPQVSFHADITHDDLLPTGQKLQLGATYEAAVRRPDRIYTAYSGDIDERRFWYDGKTITLYDPVLDVYGSEPGKPTIDATVEHLTKVLGFAPPLSDLMTSDPAATLRKNAIFGFVVGRAQVGGVPCHHLAFVEENIDWQIWIADGTEVVPRKLIITYKSLPGAPQFTALFSDWDLATRPPDSLFKAAPPPSASRISFLGAAKPSTPKPAQGGN